MRFKRVVSLFAAFVLGLWGVVLFDSKPAQALDHICVPNSEGVCVQPHVDAFLASAPSDGVAIVMEDDADLVTVIECTVNAKGRPTGNGHEGVASTTCTLPIDQDSWVFLHSTTNAGLANNNVECGEMFPFTPACFSTIATVEDCTNSCNPGTFWSEGRHFMRVPEGNEILTVQSSTLVSCSYGLTSASCETRSVPWI